MFNTGLLPILGMALFNAIQAQADDSASIRSPQWAQPVGDQCNLHQMTPTLYRSALPDRSALPVLEKLKIGTVINFLPESDSTWLESSDIKLAPLSYRTNPVEDSDVLAVLRAIQARKTTRSFGQWRLQHQCVCLVFDERQVETGSKREGEYYSCATSKNTELIGVFARAHIINQSAFLFMNYF